MFLYSDQWRLNSNLHKTSLIHITEKINIQYWVNQENELIGTIVNFEFADDAHYELLAENWNLFIKLGLNIKESEMLKTALERFFDVDLPHVHFEEVLKFNNIEYKKIAFY